MATYVLFTPERRDVGMVKQASRPAERAIGRIAQPLKVGKTLLRTGGTWTEHTVPTVDETVAVDTDTDGTALYLRGGHWTRILLSTYNEILASGFTGDYLLDGDDGIDPVDTPVSGYPSAYPGCYPTAEDILPDPPAESQSFLPSTTLLPGADVYPGVP